MLVEAPAPSPVRTDQEAEADLLQKKEAGAEANQAAMDIIPTAQHILDNYDILTIEEKTVFGSWYLRKPLFTERLQEN